MSALLHCDDFCLSEEEVSRIWEAVRTHMNIEDVAIHISCKTLSEMQELNRKYRGKDAPTNVLTFRYEEGEAFPNETEEKNYDVVICQQVAQQEAQERTMTEKDYTALLLVHGFLHAIGLDHEASSEAEATMMSAEQEILSQAGFTPDHL